MSRPTRFASLTAAFALATAAHVSAQATDSKPVDDPPVFQNRAQAQAAADAAAARAGTAPKPKRPKRERVMSDELAATLAVGMPQYQPPKPVEKKEPEPPAAEEEDANKPKNGIIRLPDYVVREKRPPVFKERDLAGSERKADLGLKQNPGLNFGPFASLNRPIALAMYREQERLDSMAEMADEAKTARRVGDKDGADYIMRQSHETYIRRDDNVRTYGLGPK